MPTTQRPRGCRPAPHKLASATPFRMIRAATPSPADFITIPPQLSMWLNDQEGDCVSAEEAFSIDAAATSAGQGGYVVPDASLQAFVTQHGFAGGADLQEVMQVMQATGMATAAGTFTDGSSAAVDWTNYDELCAAIYQSKASVKIAVAANQLELVVSSQNGWWLVNAYVDNNTDHCVGLCGYGTAAYLAQQLGVPMAAGVDPNTPCVALFTWGTIGIVAHASLNAICREAYVRTPSSLRNGVPVVPQPSPQPTPTPTPAPPPTPVVDQKIKYAEFLYQTWLDASERAAFKAWMAAQS